MVRFIIILIFVNFCLFFKAECQTDSKGKIIIIQDERIEQLVEKHITLNKKQQGIPGYRVQIFFDSGTNSKNKANKSRAEFLLKFSDTEAYVIFQSPNYKVRVGDFRTRIEAKGFLQQIINYYPNAYPVKDIIQFPKID